MNKLAMLLLLAASGVWAQSVGGGGVPWSGGGSGNLPTATAAGQVPVSSSAGTTYTASSALNALTSVNNVRYLSCATDLGAQINTAVTSLGAAGGQIILPNCTTATWTTTATNVPFNVSIHGYGQNATVISCTVAGDCLQTLSNPFVTGETGAEIDSFSLNGNSAANQVLIHANASNAYTWHDLSLTNAPVCMEFDNSVDQSGGGTFSERNRTYNIRASNCTAGFLLNGKGTGASSFAYNTFEFGGGNGDGQWLVVLQNDAQVYGGSIDVTCNHTSSGGTAGGCVHILDTSFSGPLNPSEHLYITAEENGSGSASVVSATGSGALNFEGYVLNGAGAAPALSTTIGGSNAANVHFANAFGVTSSASGFGTSVATDTDLSSSSGGAPRAFFCPNQSACGLALGQNWSNNIEMFYAPGSPAHVQFLFGSTDVLQLGTDFVTVPGSLNVGPNSNSSNATLDLQSANGWALLSTTAGNFGIYSPSINTTPLSLVGDGTSFHNQFKIGSASLFVWSSTAQYADSASPDTGFSRPSADTVACGNGTSGNASCLFQAASVTTALISQSAAGVVASASTIAPTTPLVEISGTTGINTITLPSGFTSGCFDMLTEGVVVFGTSGNIQATVTSVADTYYRACYWPAISKWTIK